MAVLYQALCLHGYLVRSGFSFKVYVTSALVDLYSKCGSLEDAVRVFECSFEKDVVLWSSMIADLTALPLFQSYLHAVIMLKDYLRLILPILDTILMANLYASGGKWNHVEAVKRFIKERGMRKIPGYSTVEAGNEIHKYLSGEKIHQQMDLASNSKLFAPEKGWVQMGQNCTPSFIEDLQPNCRSQCPLATGNYSVGTPDVAYVRITARQQKSN
ncbi:hypothetical protein M5K25_001804 [Dendrobium thyrsiflorum]|uniref:Pentatricopeptide repeat-containing protein n=1 Tax=Dendrobium thyrsiflorum TaxID=117978 RepID=A0ABD0W448_DENTH